MKYRDNDKMPPKGYLKIDIPFYGIHRNSGNNNHYDKNPPWKYTHQDNFNEPSIGGNTFQKMMDLQICQKETTQEEASKMYQMGYEQLLKQ